MVSSIFKADKRDILFETAMSAIDSIKAFLSLKNETGEQIDLSKAVFHKIFPNDPSSPAIYWIEKDQYVIYYPPNSKPYSHSFEDKVKLIECLSGILFDANSERKILKGGKLAVYPGDNYKPYTESEQCILRVCIKPNTPMFSKENLESILDQICG